MFDSLDLTVSSSYTIIFFGIVLLSLYSFFVYKFTIPQLSKPLKIFLIFLRSAAIILIFILIFEPTISFSHSEVETPINLLFIDNSNSLAHKDSSENADALKQMIKDFHSSKNISSEILLFDSGIRKIENPDTVDKMEIFNGSLTDFESVISEIEKDERKIASATIVSDGKITSGKNPLFRAEKLGVPIFTIGIGDTTIYKDVAVESVLYNSIIYRDSKAKFETVIINNAFPGERAKVTLQDKNGLIEEKVITLNENGINKIEFEYTPEKSGQEIFTISVSQFEEERLIDNNSKSFRITVLESKLNILILAGSPSSDFSFIKRSLLQNEDYQISEHVEITSLEKSNSGLEEKLDTAKVLLMVNYPGKHTPQNDLLKVTSKIKDANLPYLFILGNNIEQDKLTFLSEILNFNLLSNPDRSYETQMNVINKYSPLFSGTGDKSEIWNILPPINYSGARYQAKVGAQIIASHNVNGTDSGVPLIITSTSGNYKSISVLASNIWKWKLKSNLQTEQLFDLLIDNSIKWLNTDLDIKRFQLRTHKDIYTRGEPVKFIAEYYDESLQPINDGNIQLTFDNFTPKSKVNFISEGDGKYSAQIENMPDGNYNFTAIAQNKNDDFETENGSFLVEKTNIEFVDPILDKNFLTKLSELSGGKYFEVDDFPILLKRLSGITDSQRKEINVIESYNLWSFETLLAILILIFAIEWIIRKRSGLL